MPFRQLRFAYPLEARYQREIAPERLEHFIFSGKLSLLLYIGFLPVDWFFVPDVFRMALLLRVLLFAPFCIWLIWMVRRHQAFILTMPSTLYDMTVVATGLMAALILAILSASTRSPYAIMYQGGFLPMILYGNLVQRLRFRHALFYTAALLVMHACSVWTADQPYQPVMVPMSLMLLSVGIYTLFSNYRLELDDRERYLQIMREHALREQLQFTQDQLAEASRRDSLTGAANRRHFDEYMQSLWNERHADGGIVSMLLVDVDHFKAYNDRYGHPAGDECLRYVAKELARHLPDAGGLVARWGGEEFAVVLPGVDSQSAYDIAQAMARGVQDLGLRHEHAASGGTVTVSIGLATLEPRLIREPIDNLVARADSALYVAKRLGRNRVERQEFSEPRLASAPPGGVPANPG